MKPKTIDAGDLTERGRHYADLCRAYNQALHERDQAERQVGETQRAMLTARTTFWEEATG